MLMAYMETLPAQPRSLALKLHLKSRLCPFSEANLEKFGYKTKDVEEQTGLSEMEVVEQLAVMTEIHLSV